MFWQIGSSATLGTSSTFAGSILALTSISIGSGVTLNGRALARNGAVTLINDTITVPTQAPTPTPTPTPSPTPGPSPPPPVGGGRTADFGGSNGNRTRLWKVELQKLADDTGLEIAVCHLPPGTSKWNRIEHRLFSFIHARPRAAVRTACPNAARPRGPADDWPPGAR